MRLNPEAVALEGDRETIRSLVAGAEVVPLLAAVAQVTGDLTVLRPELRPDPLRMLEPDAGYTPELKDEAYDAAADALAAFAASGRPRAAQPSPEALRTLLDFVTGGMLRDDDVPVLREELALDGDDLRAPSWRADDVAPGRRFRVLVVGAGMSGIVVAHRLLQAGVEVLLIEKDAEVGGTWYENTYPGCRVDVPSHFYSYSFAQTTEWPQRFSTQPVLLDYFRACAEQLGVRPHVRFGTEVLDATYADDGPVWRLRVRGPDGAEETIEGDALVSAVGQLNRPSWPSIPGRERFAGPSFHSAEWDDSVVLDGKKVAVIGTGASACQFIPAVADVSAHLTVFQRTPPWLIPTPDYHDDVPANLRALLAPLPEYARWDRLWVYWRTHEGLLPCAQADPGWDDGGRSVSAMNDLVRQLFAAYFELEFPDAELREKVLPTYPPLAKRFVRDNGIWSRTMHRENVDLVTDGIAEITERGVRTCDGVEHEVDVLIYGTGFQASEFLTPMRVFGRDGVELHDRWKGDARAYLGITIPEMPNLFLLYGPNTNIVVNGSIIFFSECGARYITESVHLLLEGGWRTLEVEADVHDAFNAWVDAENARMAWSVSDVPSWYKNATGRSAQNWPFSLLEYWRRTLAPEPADYRLTPLG